MQTVKKFTTFNDLKSFERKTTEYTVRLKKHNDFEKFIKDIRSIKVHEGNENKPKQVYGG